MLSIRHTETTPLENIWKLWVDYQAFHYSSIRETGWTWMPTKTGRVSRKTLLDFGIWAPGVWIQTPASSDINIKYSCSWKRSVDGIAGRLHFCECEMENHTTDGSRQSLRFYASYEQPFLHAAEGNNRPEAACSLKTGKMLRQRKSPNRRILNHDAQRKTVYQLYNGWTKLIPLKR